MKLLPAVIYLSQGYPSRWGHKNVFLSACEQTWRRLLKSTARKYRIAWLSQGKVTIMEVRVSFNEASAFSPLKAGLFPIKPCCVKSERHIFFFTFLSSTWQMMSCERRQIWKASSASITNTFEFLNRQLCFSWSQKAQGKSSKFLRALVEKAKGGEEMCLRFNPLLALQGFCVQSSQALFPESCSVQTWKLCARTPWKWLPGKGVLISFAFCASSALKPLQSVNWEREFAV